MKLKIRKTFRRKHKNNRRTRRRQKRGNSLEVSYDNIQLSGQELSRSLTQSEPSIKFPTTDKLYTLGMWDPDVSPQIQPGVVHLLVTNLKSQNNIESNEVLSYKGLAPPSGIHRYFFGLFEQQGHISVKQPERTNFNIYEFIRDNNLKKVSDTFMRVRA